MSPPEVWRKKKEKEKVQFSPPLFSTNRVNNDWRTQTRWTTDQQTKSRHTHTHTQSVSQWRDLALWDPGFHPPAPSEKKKKGTFMIKQHTLVNFPWRWSERTLHRNLKITLRRRMASCPSRCVRTLNNAEVSQLGYWFSIKSSKSEMIYLCCNTKRNI